MHCGRYYTMQLFVRCRHPAVAWPQHL